MSLSLSRRSNSGPAIRVLSRIRTRASVFVQTLGQSVDILHVIVPGLDLVILQLLETGVVKNRDFHFPGRVFLLARRQLRHPDVRGTPGCRQAALSGSLDERPPKALARHRENRKAGDRASLPSPHQPRRSPEDPHRGRLLGEEGPSLPARASLTRSLHSGAATSTAASNITGRRAARRFVLHFYVVHPVKTEYSRDRVPLDTAVVEALILHKERSFCAPDGSKIVEMVLNGRNSTETMRRNDPRAAIGSFLARF